MTLKKIFIKIKIFLNFFKKKHQKSFYLNEKFKNKVKFYKNRICYIYDYYIFNSKDLIEKNYVAKVSKYCEVFSSDCKSCLDSDLFVYFCTFNTTCSSFSRAKAQQNF